MNFANFLDNLVGIGTLLIQILIVFIILCYIYVKKLGRKLPRGFKSPWDFLRENSLLFAFLFVLGSTIISLIYSELIGYAACDLCWYQRAMIYPQIVILGVALFKKNKEIFSYVLGLNIIGAIIAIYQWFFQMFGSSACPVGEVDCFNIYILKFGYITIPMMSFTLFISVMILTYLWKHYDSKNPRIESE